MAKRMCAVDECDRPSHARGWCTKHYQRWQRHGDPTHVDLVQLPGSPEDRFWPRVDKQDDGCWLWTATLDSDGYGSLWVQGTMVSTHRFAYELLVGPIPDGLTLDHLCRVRRCVNPDHLEPVTHRENTLRGESFAAANAAKTRCPRGHPYDDENTYVDGDGGRHCRTCRI